MNLKHSKLIQRKTENQKQEKLLTSSSVVERDYEKCLSGSDKLDDQHMALTI
jgi:hypothetical protein